MEIILKMKHYVIAIIFVTRIYDHPPSMPICDLCGTGLFSLVPLTLSLLFYYL